MDTEEIKEKTLSEISFGERVAEDESDRLAQYFVETDQWRRISRGEVDVIYGAKGTGKSAIYSLLINRAEQFRERAIIITPAENPQGALAFNQLLQDPPPTEEQFRYVWKLYFLSLAGKVLRDEGVSGSESRIVQEALHEAGLIDLNWSLKRILKAVGDYVRDLNPPKSLEGEMKVDPTTGLPIGFAGRIVFNEPDAKMRKAGLQSVDDLLVEAEAALEKADLSIWLLLDRLDVAFIGASADMEGKALRALFRVYRDLASYRHITPKIFLRTDIWESISKDGFREGSHITRTITIRWDDLGLMNLIVQRLLSNWAIQEFYDADPEEVLGDQRKQKDLFYRVFPRQVEEGEKKPTTFNWIISRTKDGNDICAPREIIHLLDEARNLQLSRIERGEAAPDGDQLFSGGVFKEALEPVSNERLHQTIYSEYPHLKNWIEPLREGKAHQFPDTLAELWNVPERKAREIAEELCGIGIFEKLGEAGDASYRAAFLYRPALSLVMGKAKGAWPKKAVKKKRR